MPPIEALFSLLPGSCPQATHARPSQESRDLASRWGPRQAGWRQEERPLRSIRIRTGVPVAAVKGLENELEPGMTVSRSKLMIM